MGAAEWTPGGAGGRAIPVINFTSDDFSYYDHFDWPYEIDWHHPRRARTLV